jgi:Tol biopolymer transport system component
MIEKTLGHYKVGEQLGRGGMGEVYLADDLNLNRRVALKFLPDAFTGDPERMARFEREAKLLASLNNPNIAAIYGLEQAEGKRFIVMELVEGETLAQRLSKGALPIEEALGICKQIAEGLEAAHEKGVIHRDLKPANIKVTPDGKVKVLDFGLAKAFAGEQTELNLSNSPTLSNAATQRGVILGTAAYMSPEQAKGKTVDKRADVWAFGCVVFEMLTGRAAFQAEDISEILASVIKGDVKLDLLPANIHPRVCEMLSRCLQKDLRRRYPGIIDARYEIEQALADPSGVLVQPLAAAELQSKWRLGLPWIAAVVVLAAIIAGVAVWSLKPTPQSESRQVTRFYYELPKDQRLGHYLERAVAVSPDGRQFVYSTTGGGLYLRSMDELDAKFIAGTEGAQQPFFSPNGKWIGYFSAADSQLKKIAVNGGAPVALTTVDNFTVGCFSWGPNDIIVYSSPSRGIMRVSAKGGVPVEIIKKAENEGILCPQMLPDGESILFITYSSYTPLRSMKVAVQSLKSGKRRELFAGNIAQFAQYLPTRHIVYAEGNNLIARPFDPEKLELTGEPISLAERIYRIGLWPQYAMSDLGTLVFVPEAATASAIAQRSLVWVDRNGKEEPLAAQPNAYVDPRISPDGTQVAVTIVAGENRENTGIWIWDLIRQTLTPLTSHKGRDISPLWTPDGKRIAYLSFRDSGYNLNWKAANGTAKEEPLSSGMIVPASWSGDGKNLVLMRVALAGIPNFDIGTLSMEGDRKWKPLLQEKYVEYQPRISPNGRWIAYASDESGQGQIYVRPFPDVEKDKWTVSINGGYSPLWSPDGRELFYRNGDAVIVVTVKTEPAFTLYTPKILFRGVYASPSANWMQWTDVDTWDISRDGKRFLMMKESGSAASTAGGPRRINIVLNWFEELKQRVPLK